MSGQFSETAEHIDVGYVAQLARLALTDEESVMYQKQLDQILEYVAELDELDVSDVPPMAHPHPVNNVFRDDVARPGLDRERVLANAPAQRNDQFVVPKIIE